MKRKHERQLNTCSLSFTLFDLNPLRPLPPPKTELAISQLSIGSTYIVPFSLEPSDYCHRSLLPHSPPTSSWSNLDHIRYWFGFIGFPWNQSRSYNYKSENDRENKKIQRFRLRSTFFMLSMKSYATPSWVAGRIPLWGPPMDSQSCPK